MRHADLSPVFLRWLLETVTKAGRVLDLGCGDGKLAFALAPHAAEVAGLGVESVVGDVSGGGSISVTGDSVAVHAMSHERLSSGLQLVTDQSDRRSRCGGCGGCGGMKGIECERVRGGIVVGCRTVGGSLVTEHNGDLAELFGGVGGVGVE